MLGSLEGQEGGEWAAKIAAFLILPREGALSTIKPLRKMVLLNRAQHTQDSSGK
jgi:hypothetical protein